MCSFLEKAKINPAFRKNVQPMWCQNCDLVIVKLDESNGNFFEAAGLLVKAPRYPNHNEQPEVTNEGETVFFALCHDCQK